MDAAPTSGENRRRGKKNNRGRQGRRKRPKQHQRDGRSMQPEHYMPEHGRDESSVLGGRVPRLTDRRSHREEGPVDDFALFCAYHLGITAADGYQRPQLEDVARRLAITPDEVQRQLVDYGLDLDTVRRSRYDMEAAQLDIRVAPEGISRTEIARDLYEAYLEARDGSSRRGAV